MDDQSPENSPKWMKLLDRLRNVFRPGGKSAGSSATAFRVGDRVQDILGQRGTVTGVDPLTNYPLGTLHVLYDKGRESLVPLKASGFQRVEPQEPDCWETLAAAYRRRSEYREFDDARQRHDFQIVKVADACSMFEEISAIGSHGFSRAGPGRFALWATPEITHIIRVAQVKGLGIILRWGVGLTWMPDIKRDRVHWRKTLRTLTLSLHEDMSSLAKPGLSVGDEEALGACYGYGPVYLRETMVAMWTRWGADILEWFRQAHSPEQILSLAERQARQRWPYSCHAPDPRLVHSFTLARVGRLEEAKSCLREAIAGRQWEKAAESVLIDALHRVARGPAGPQGSRC